MTNDQEFISKGDLMVARRKQQRLRMGACALTRKQARPWISLMTRAGLLGIAVGVLGGLLFASRGEAQTLRNQGQIINTGTIRVKNQATGLPASIDGIFEFFGADQTVPAVRYRNLLLSGSGTKSTAGGSFAVAGNLSVAAPVTLRINPADIVDLGGTLTELGYVTGSIRTSSYLGGSTSSSSFSNIGATISWTGTAPDTTSVKRVSGTAYTANGNQSIMRSYEMIPRTNARLNATFVFRYDNRELNGNNAPALELWRSVDGGATWRRQGGATVDTAAKTISIAGVRALGLWTAVDSTKPMGVPEKEWVPQWLTLFSGGNDTVVVNTTAKPFVVQVTDDFDNPLDNVQVNFQITFTPAGAVGHSLTTVSATTDSNGLASTTLRMGNVAGRYQVKATSPLSKLAAQNVVFDSYARQSAVKLLLAGGANQLPKPILGRLDSAFAVKTVDSTGAGVSGTPVHFAIVFRPPNADSSAITIVDTVTDAGGNASTFLRLGTKVGIYTVRATSAPLPKDTIFFNGQAVHGPVIAMNRVRGNGQSKQVVATLDTQLVVQVLDIGGNPVPGVNVGFAVATPPGASGFSIIPPAASTDSSGLASTSLTFGDKAGVYTVTATSNPLPAVSFTATAVPATPRKLIAVSGNGQSKPILTSLGNPFTVRITDQYDNAVAGKVVQFTARTPVNAIGSTLSKSADTTDASGQSSTLLTLGDKVGTYSVVARTPDLPSDSLVFAATAVPGVPSTVAIISGNLQTTNAGTTLDSSFVIEVRDAGKNPVSGVTVKFAIDSIPVGAAGSALSDTSKQTDTLGRSSTVLTLGDREGLYRVLATVQSVSNAAFTAKAIILKGNLNRDKDINIADLTMMIDRLIYKDPQLSVPDSIAADINADGKIDVRDFILLRQYLLTGDQSYLLAPSQPSVTPSSGASPGASSTLSPSDTVLSSKQLVTTSGEFELTEAGLRFNLSNSVPVKGVEVILTLRKTAMVDKYDVLFKRLPNGEQVVVNSSGNEVRVLVYHPENVPIDTGRGSLFRLAKSLVQDTTEIQSVQVIISAGINNVGAPIQSVKAWAIGKYPLTYKLEQNFPNPFNSETKIRYQIPDVAGKFAKVALQVYNILGQKVKTVVKGEQEAGTYTVSWDGTDDTGFKVASGVYIYRLIANDYLIAKKMVVLK